MKRFQKLFFHTPLVNVFIFGSEAYHDYYRWPLKDKRTFENWKQETSWGRLFARLRARRGERVRPPPNGARPRRSARRVAGRSCILARLVKTLQQMLRELARPDVSEFAVVSDRLPCIKVAGKYEPIDDHARSSDDILEMLVASGGGRYVDEMESQPVAWTTRIDGLGSVGVQAVMRDGRIQARFTVVRRPSVRAMPAAARRSQHPPARKSVHPRAKSTAPRRAQVAPAHARGEAGHDDAALRRASQPATKAVAAQRGAHSPPPSSLDGLLADAADVRRERRPRHRRPAPARARRRGSPAARRRARRREGRRDAPRPIVPERLRAILDEQGSCDFALDRGGLGRFRVNVSRQRTGLKACFRLIRRELPTLASLGLPAEIERATHHHQGLVVVTGPTGHGKTCTLAAIVDIINRETTHHVITVEDPVEYLHPRKKARKFPCL